MRPGLYVMTTPETPFTTALVGSVAMRLRFGLQLSKTSTATDAVHSPYPHPSNGHAFQSRKGNVGAACATYGIDSLAVSGDVSPCVVLGDSAVFVGCARTGLGSEVHFVRVC